MQKRDSTETVASLVYVLQAVSFLFGITYLIAVIIAHVKRDDARGTWVESHFRWQIRTFWYSLGWGAIGAVLLLLLIGWFVLAADSIWVIYRVTKGWLYFADKKPMYPESTTNEIP